MQLTKSQKKNIKYCNKFLTHGIKENNVDCPDVHSLGCGDQMNINKKPATIANGVDDIADLESHSETNLAKTSGIVQVIISNLFFFCIVYY